MDTSLTMLEMCTRPARLCIVHGGVVSMFQAGGHYSGISEFGVLCARMIPRKRADAHRWVQRLRARLDRFEEENRVFRWPDQGPYNHLKHSGLELVYHCRGIGLDATYKDDIALVYTINLDWLYFGVQGVPIFKLLCMPPTRGPRDRSWIWPDYNWDTNTYDGPFPPYYKFNTKFERFVGHNSFRQICATQDTPARYLYQPKLARYPVNATNRAVFDRVCPGSSAVSAADILRNHRWISSDEDVRIALVEALVLSHMATSPPPNSPHILTYPALLAAHDAASAAPTIRLVGGLMMHMIAHDGLTDVWGGGTPPRCDFEWPRLDLCVHYAPLLDAPDHRALGVARVVELARKRYTQGWLWGVVFSIEHCVLVRVDARPGAPCKHTGALKFLPDWFAQTRSTEGMTALAQLLHIPPAPPAPYATPSVEVGRHAPIMRLPTEVLWMIADGVDDRQDLWSLAHAVPPFVWRIQGWLHRSYLLDRERIMLLLPACAAAPSKTPKTADMLDHPIYEKITTAAGPLCVTAFLCVDERRRFRKYTIVLRSGDRYDDDIGMPQSFEEDWTDWCVRHLGGRIHPPKYFATYHMDMSYLSTGPITTTSLGIPEDWSGQKELDILLRRTIPLIPFPDAYDPDSP